MHGRDHEDAVAALQAAVEAIEAPAAAPQLSPLSEDGARAVKAALRLLKFRGRSEQELRTRLAEKDFSAEHVEEAMERLDAWRLLDDAEFARQWVADRAVARGATRARLRRELEQKGIGPVAIADAVDQVSDDDERSRAHVLVSQRLARHERSSLSDRETQLKVKRRLVAFLQRRGYSPGVALTVVEAEIETASGFR